VPDHEEHLAFVDLDQKLVRGQNRLIFDANPQDRQRDTVSRGVCGHRRMLAHGCRRRLAFTEAD
jgi:hypothetical protein